MVSYQAPYLTAYMLHLLLPSSPSSSPFLPSCSPLLLSHPPPLPSSLLLPSFLPILLLRSPTRGPGSTSSWPGSMLLFRNGSAMHRWAGPRNTSSISRTCAWGVTPSIPGWRVCHRWVCEAVRCNGGVFSYLLTHCFTVHLFLRIYLHLFSTDYCDVLSYWVMYSSILSSLTLCFTVH